MFYSYDWPLPLVQTMAGKGPRNLPFRDVDSSANRTGQLGPVGQSSKAGVAQK